LLLGVLMRAKRCSSIWWLKRFAVAILLSALVAIPAPRTPAQSAEVLQAQIELQARGYDPGPLDGFMGRRTRRALRQFQEDIGVPVTGVLDEATIETLTAPEPEPQAEPARPHAPVLTPFPTTEQLAPTPTPNVVPDGVRVAPVQPQPSLQSETTSEPGTSVEPSPVLAHSKRAEANDTGQYGIVVALITFAIAGIILYWIAGFILYWIVLLPCRLIRRLFSKAKPHQQRMEESSVKRV
jgi:peptidoglycan hydrolase-like protein with peptidoglycan-binding domain